MKHCNKCNQDKPLNEFHNDKWSADGKTRNCKVCNNTASKAARDKDPKAYDQRNWATIQAKPEARRERKRKNSKTETAQNNRLIYTFNKTLVWYWDTLTDQNDGCGICGLKEPYGKSDEFFHVDHDHDCCDSHRSCGKCVRGILCGRCNAYVIPVFEGKINGNIADLENEVAAYIGEYLYQRALIDEMGEEEACG